MTRLHLHRRNPWMRAVGVAQPIRGNILIDGAALLSICSAAAHDASASSKALASFKSRVSKPSVNQP
jgi:hypothetical protein